LIAAKIGMPDPKFSRLPIPKAIESHQFPEAFSASKDREDQTEDDANDDAGDDRKIKDGIASLDPDIAGQSSQPFWSEPAPQNKSD
jgi:hypothetical protein